MALDRLFRRFKPNLISPLETSEAVAASTAHEFTNPTRAILVTGDGNLTIRLIRDNADLTLAVTAGTFLPLRVTHVRVASTASVLGFW